MYTGIWTKRLKTLCYALALTLAGTTTVKAETEDCHIWIDEFSGWLTNSKVRSPREGTLYNNWWPNTSNRYYPEPNFTNYLNSLSYRNYPIVPVTTDAWEKPSIYSSGQLTWSEVLDIILDYNLDAEDRKDRLKTSTIWYKNVTSTNWYNNNGMAARNVPCGSGMLLADVIVRAKNNAQPNQSWTDRDRQYFGGWLTCPGELTIASENGAIFTVQNSTNTTKPSSLVTGVNSSIDVICARRMVEASLDYKDGITRNYSDKTSDGSGDRDIARIPPGASVRLTSCGGTISRQDGASTGTETEGRVTYKLLKPGDSTFEMKFPTVEVKDNDTVIPGNCSLPGQCDTSSDATCNGTHKQTLVNNTKEYLNLVTVVQKTRGPNANMNFNGKFEIKVGELR